MFLKRSTSAFSHSSNLIRNLPANNLQLIQPQKRFICVTSKVSSKK